MASQSTGVDYPHLEAYIQRGMGKRPTKKYEFVKETKHEYLSNI
jgi:hypothetical protein